MMSGLPASGKSTAAKELVRASGNAVRLNRDLLRTMLHFDKWSPRNEGDIIEVEKALARFFLNKGKNVIVDDTNLAEYHERMWITIANEMDAKFEKRRVKTSVDECIERDMNRDVNKFVGADVIIQMAMANGLMPPPKKGYVICDLDGTLCDINHRLHYVKGDEKKDWKSFFRGIKDDKLRFEVLDKLKGYENEGYEIVFVSARPDTYRPETEHWLAMHLDDVMDYKTLIMRKGGDRRPDTEVKEEILMKYFEGGKHVHKVFDDRPSVIRMWRSHGLEVEDCGAGIEF